MNGSETKDSSGPAAEAKPPQQRERQEEFAKKPADEEYSDSDSDGERVVRVANNRHTHLSAAQNRVRAQSKQTRPDGIPRLSLK